MPDPTATAAAAAPLRILVVDDEEIIGRALSRILRDHQVTVHAVAAEALQELLTGPPPDVIISDLMMPGLPGWELHAALCAQRPELARRLLFITGGTNAPQILAFLRSCGQPCLEKPFDLQALRVQVQALAQRSG